MDTAVDLLRDTRGTCPGIKVTGLSLRFGNLSVFEDLSFQVAGGQFVVLLGPSGVGKSSLLKILAGLAKPTAGRCEASDGKTLAGRVAYMGQTDLLYPWLRVIDNVMLGPRLRGEPKDVDRAMHLLERVGLAGRARALPSELSGGMRQRAAIARTLYEQRPIVLMDEPFSRAGYIYPGAHPGSGGGNDGGLHGAADHPRPAGSLPAGAPFDCAVRPSGPAGARRLQCRARRHARRMTRNCCRPRDICCAC